MLVAEREGFEPPEVLPSTVFKTAAIDHSAISPIALQSYALFLNRPNFQPTFFKTFSYTRAKKK